MIFVFADCVNQAIQQFNGLFVIVSHIKLPKLRRNRFPI